MVRPYGINLMEPNRFIRQGAARCAMRCIGRASQHRRGADLAPQSAMAQAGFFCAVASLRFLSDTPHRPAKRAPGSRLWRARGQASPRRKIIPVKWFPMAGPCCGSEDDGHAVHIRGRATPPRADCAKSRRDGAHFPARGVADALWWESTTAAPASGRRKNWLPPDPQHNCQQALALATAAPRSDTVQPRCGGVIDGGERDGFAGRAGQAEGRA